MFIFNAQTAIIRYTRCMDAQILLINPAIFDFTAYDFWLKPLGLLTVAGRLRGRADMRLFDYLDRQHRACENNSGDRWNRGAYLQQNITTPLPLGNIRRRFKRFGLPRELFQQFLKNNTGFDFAMIQTVMTYWYLGVEEAIEDLRTLSPNTKIILGGPYATICPEHARSLGADLVVEGNDLKALWQMLGVEPDIHQPPLWEAYPKLKTAAMKINTGCPCKCTYCSVPKYYPKFSTIPIDDAIAQIELLVELGVTDIAFYDDALLAKPQQTLIPLLEHIIKNSLRINLHTPNALHARLLGAELADLFVQAGLKAVYLGYESSSKDFQLKTGGKVFAGDLKTAVENLLNAGAEPANITAYQILGHPHSDLQELEQSLRFANSLGIKVMLADFSPIPSTEDGEYCRKFTDIDEPLNHNKTAFPAKVIGTKEVNRLKQLCKKINQAVG